MATYIMLSTLTAEGRKTLYERPERLDEVNQEVTRFGCKIMGQYSVMGAYDFVTILDAPDNGTMAHLSVELGARGTIEIVTLAAVPLSQLMSELKKGQRIEKL